MVIPVRQKKREYPLWTAVVVVCKRRGLRGKRRSGNDVQLIQVRFYYAGESDMHIQIQQNLDF